MSTRGSLSVVVVALVLLALGTTPSRAAEGAPLAVPLEVSVSGGVHLLNSNDTAFPETFMGIPIVGSVAYRITDIWAVEGEFSYVVPIEKDVDVSPGVTVKRKSPDQLAYLASVRATLPLKGTPLQGTPWSPYATVGAGGITFLSDTDAKRLPALAKSQTAFAASLGVGTGYRLTQQWVLLADVRGLVAFPSKDAEGLSTDGSADPIWMERGTVGVKYCF
jgi:opacity protein-like surface antigen